MQRQRSIWMTGLLMVAVMLGMCCLWQFHLLRELNVYVEKDSAGLLSFKANETIPSVYTLTKGVNRDIPPDQLMLQVSLFGLIPLRQMVVDVIPQVRLVPGGHSIGVTLNSQGVMVVGFAPLYDDNAKTNPAKDAGVEVGDTVLAINGQKVENEHEMGSLIEKLGTKAENIQLQVRRKGLVKKIAVRPKYCSDSASYRIGLYVRDSAAGVGTLTFIEPKTGQFGALGHVITDADTNQPIDVYKGRIIRAGVQRIQKGRKGLPGEKVGVFLEDSSFSGKITQNTQVGIFGTVANTITNPYYPKPLPVAASNQIRTGDAEILTVVKGEKIEKFQIKIRKLLIPGRPDGKGMIIEITDPVLLQKTGGIIQGMSGSPIIQDGRIVGAVTHVFINNPKMGYGVLIENMLLEAGALPRAS